MSINPSNVFPFCTETPYTKRKFLGLTPRPHVTFCKFTTKVWHDFNEEDRHCPILMPYTSCRFWYIGNKLDYSALINYASVPYFLKELISQIETNGYYDD